MTLQEALKQHSAGGWSMFDKLPDHARGQLEEQAKAKKLEAADVAEVFRSPAGQRVLSRLITQLLLAPYVLPTGGTWTAEQQAIHAARRDGQNSVVLMILNAIELAAGKEPDVKRGDDA